MALKLGLTDIEKLNLGTSAVDNVYLGNNQVYSSFLPSNVSNNVAWFDADDAATITESSGSVVAWADKSTEQNNATAVSAPSIGSDTINGKNTVSFTETHGFSIADADSLTMGSGFTLLYVGRNRSSAEYRYFLSKQNYSVRHNLGDVVRLTLAGGFVNLAAANESQEQIAAFRVKPGAEFSYWEGGALIGTSSSVPSLIADSSDPLYLGCLADSTSGLKGYYGEFLIYNRPLSDAEINDIAGYLSDKWALAWSDIA